MKSAWQPWMCTGSLHTRNTCTFLLTTGAKWPIPVSCLYSVSVTLSHITRARNILYLYIHIYIHTYISTWVRKLISRSTRALDHSYSVDFTYVIVTVFFTFMPAIKWPMHLHFKYSLILGQVCLILNSWLFFSYFRVATVTKFSIYRDTIDFYERKRTEREIRVFSTFSSFYCNSSFLFSLMET